MDKKNIKLMEGKDSTSLSVFSGNMAVTSDVKAFLAKFDTNHDGKISEEEVAVLKKVIADYAGKDKTLDKAEFAQMMGVDVNSPEFNKMYNSFSTLVERQTNGSSKTVVKNKDGSTVTSNFNSDGSGTQIITSKDSKGNPVKTVYTYGPGNVKQKAVSTNGSTTMTATYVNNAQGQPTIVKTVTTDKSGKVLSDRNEKFQYDEDGHRIASQYTLIKGGKEIQGRNKYEYTNGKLTRTINNVQSGTQKSETVSYYNEFGKVSKSSTVSMDTKTNAKNTTDWTMTYRPDGTLESSKEVRFRAGQDKPSIYEYKMAADGKTRIGQTHVYYKGDVLYKDSFCDGANMENRCKGNIPSERLIYEADGKTVKERISYKFDDKGILIAQETYDKDNKLIDKKDFSGVDGKIDVAYQVSRGDCYLLASLNSLASTEAGQELLQKNIKEIKDANGNVTGYEVSLPGAANARAELINGHNLPEDKVHIQGTYVVTKEELEAAAKQAGELYSMGDKDVLMLEVAYDKYRKDVVATVSDNKIPKQVASSVKGLDIPNEEMVQNGDYLAGGHSSTTIYVLTGKSGYDYNCPNKQAPTCYISQPDLQMSIPSAEAAKKPEDKVNDPQLKNALDAVITDCKDGKLDNYSVTAGFKVSQQEVNGKIVEGRGHAFSVKSMTEDQVVLANPWNPEEDIVMSMEDFKKSVKSVSVIPLNNSGTGNVNGTNGSNGSNGANGANKLKPNYTVPEGKGYTTMIKEALISQGISPTPENIEKAKAQFEEANPGAVQIYKGGRREWHGNKFLYKNAKVHIPNFKM